MSLAQLIEEALRKQGMNATVTEAVIQKEAVQKEAVQKEAIQKEAVQKEAAPTVDSRVVVKNAVSSTYTVGGIEIKIVSAAEGKVENVRVTHGGFIALDLVDGEWAQDFLDAMQRVLADMRKVG